MTIRERIIELLKTGNFLTAREIIELLGLECDERSVYEHLRHVARSVWRRSGGRERLVMKLPYCRRCGYIFTDLEEPWKPSKCPRCGSHLIEPPAFAIRNAK